MKKNIILSIDPGRGKCGVALLYKTGEVISHRVIPLDHLIEILLDMIKEYSLYCIVMGDGTGSSHCEKLLSSLKSERGIIKIDEYLTTELARKKYFKDRPPRGWRRLIPLSLQVPPEDYDDYAAIILAERFLEQDGKS